METQKNNAKTPLSTSNGNSVNQTVPPKDDAESSAAPVQEEPEVNETGKESKLYAVLELSNRFMASLQKVPRTGSGNTRNTLSVLGEADEKGITAKSRRLRDWDTRLFVLSTLKRLIDQENFEALEKEDNRIQFTRDALEIRRQEMGDLGKRHHHVPKVEKLLPAKSLAKKKAADDPLVNTREKQRMEKSRQLREKQIGAKAGMAFSEALTKAGFIKNPAKVSETPEEIPEQQIEVTEQINEVTEQINEVTEQINEVTVQSTEKKEQNRTKRGFFNFSAKG